MIGGAAMAHTILGIDFNPDLGQIKYIAHDFVDCLPSRCTQVLGFGPSLRRCRGPQNHSGMPTFPLHFDDSDWAAE